MTEPAVFRFAPSPNGRLHLGHAYSALLNQRLAERAGGRLLLRIEDIDVLRCTPALVAACLDDLAWLGLSFEQPVRRQSRHFADYRRALDRLDGMGLLYRSTVSRGALARAVAEAEGRGEAWPRDPEGAPLVTRALIREAEKAGPFALRLDMARASARARALAGPLSFEEAGEGRLAARPEDWGDVVLARKDLPTSYHLSVVVDDALQGVTDVVRGRDLFRATDVHRLLQVLLDLPQPRYRHHRLVAGQHGEKLAKSAGSTSLAELRAGGATPDDIRRRLGL
jgi:glutamyl-Q tRNA(Asp) synthetase